MEHCLSGHHKCRSPLLWPTLYPYTPFQSFAMSSRLSLRPQTSISLWQILYPRAFMCAWYKVDIFRSNRDFQKSISQAGISFSLIPRFIHSKFQPSFPYTLLRNFPLLFLSYATLVGLSKALKVFSTPRCYAAAGVVGVVCQVTLGATSWLRDFVAMTSRTFVAT